MANVFGVLISVAKVQFFCECKNAVLVLSEPEILTNVKSCSTSCNRLSFIVSLRCSKNTHAMIWLFRVLIFSIFFWPTASVVAQDTSSVVIAFYNVENLFNPSDDSLKNDDAFTPRGLNHWTYKKFTKKKNNIAKVILAMNDWSPPDIVGLEEIEDEYVLKKLCYDSPLKKYHYHYVHYDSPDARGVDVALIYRADRIKIVESRPVPIIFPFDSSCKNRDLLYVVAKLPTQDSVHVIVNHWTSRYGGYAPTIIKRNYYASVVRAMADSILSRNPFANIVIGGDLNDYPEDESVTKVLRAKDCELVSNLEENDDAQLYDLMFHFSKLQNVGSHKHEDFWGCLDHIIVSQALLNKSSPISIENRQANIFKAPFMIEPDEKYDGYRVFRTYSGPRYIGGYADHLPVFIRLVGEKSEREKHR